MYDGISTTKIDDISADIAVNMMTIDPDYATLASRIVVSNMHKTYPDKFSASMKNISTVINAIKEVAYRYDFIIEKELSKGPRNIMVGKEDSYATQALTNIRRSITSLLEDKMKIDILKEPIGKQDQYIAAYGGVTCFSFEKDDSVKAWPLRMSEEIRSNLEDSLALFFTGFTRSASAILKDQDDKTKKADSDMIANLNYVKELGLRSQAALEAGQLNEFGALMHEHWVHKKRRSQGMSNPQIDRWYETAMANGATGGKLIGAGGGGFLMFHAEDKKRLRHAMLGAGLKEVRFRFDFEGTQTVIQ